MTNWREEIVEQATGASVGQLCLYVAGTSARSERAIANVKHCCDTHFAGRYALNIIDLLQHPELAQRDQVTALPLLVRRQPSPQQFLIGDLSDTPRLLRHLAFSPAS